MGILVTDLKNKEVKSFSKVLTVSVGSGGEQIAVVLLGSEEVSVLLMS